MTDPAPIGDPIRKSVLVPLDRQAAFDLFTSGIDRWWPKDSHSLSARDGSDDRASVRVEPREGGRVLERLADGREVPWATVTVWQPGRRLGLSWYVGREEDDATFVDVVFTQTEAGTRVDLTHAGFGAHGARAAEICGSYNEGWDKVLGRCFAGACRSVTA